MKGRVIQYFFAAILCVGACRVLFPPPQDYVSETQTSNPVELSFENVEQEYSSKHLIISVAKEHGRPGFPSPFKVWEKEETDDENDASEVCNKQRDLSGEHSETSFVEFLIQSDKVSPIPLFILLHSWKHFLS